MDYFRLCGGTLFTLIVDAALLKPTNGELYTGTENLIKDENMLTSLLHIAMPSLPEVSRDDAQNFKQCKVKQSRNLKMVNCEIGKALQARMQSEYSACHQEMASFISKFLDTHQRKEQKLIRALIELITQDQSIPLDHYLYVHPDGTAVTKNDINAMIVINVPSFLLGVLLFTLIEIEDNSIGKDTYNEWCPAHESNRARRYYQGHMGEKITQKISFDYKLDEKSDISPVQTLSDDRILTEDSKKRPLPPANTPEKIAETERRYVDELLKIYQEKTDKPDLTIDGLDAYTKFKSHFNRQRGYYYDAEHLRRGTRDIYCENGDEYFDIFLEEVYGGVIEIYDQDYFSGYDRLTAVLTAASQTTTQKSIISRETLWVGNTEKMGACHMLVNKQKLDGWK